MSVVRRFFKTGSSAVVEAAGGGEGLEVVGREDGWGLGSLVGVRWGCEERG